LKNSTEAGSNVSGDMLPIAAPVAVPNETISTSPEPAIWPAPETETRSRDVVASITSTLQVGLRPASPAIVPAVEQPKLVPAGPTTL